MEDVECRAGLGSRKGLLLFIVIVLCSQLKLGKPFSPLMPFGNAGSTLGTCSSRSNIWSWLLGRPESPLQSDEDDDPLVSPLNGNAGLDTSGASGDRGSNKNQLN